MGKVRQLLVVLGDQLDRESRIFAEADPGLDEVWMMEARQESTKVWSNKVRTAVFLSAMRHFAEDLRLRGWKVHYRQLEDSGNPDTLEEGLKQDLEKLNPGKVLVAEPGEWEVQQRLRSVCGEADVPIQETAEDHFFCSTREFREYAGERQGLRMEFFYRWMRQRTGLLMEKDGTPAGGQWNYDPENRGAFGKAGPESLLAPRRFLPDRITKEVLAVVERCFPNHPGDLNQFDWPVTPAEAHEALKDFLEFRLPNFGKYQDAMWTGDPWLYHSRLSAAMNLKLLRPAVVCEAAVEAWKAGTAPLAAVEGFVRQILGWREYVRGIYWMNMPRYRDLNALEADEPLPKFYWTGATRMNCLRQALGQTLTLGYAHHIQRLMVTGLFSLLLGVRPREIHEWYLAVYVDAVEWVEMPNTLGMSQYADGGLMASKPYVASGKYIQRMSNYCRDCPYRPGEATGERACPFTTLYWDFLIRHAPLLRSNPRMTFQLKNLNRLDGAARTAIQEKAGEWRGQFRSSPATTPYGTGGEAKPAAT